VLIGGEGGGGGGGCGGVVVVVVVVVVVRLGKANSIFFSTSSDQAQTSWALWFC